MGEKGGEGPLNPLLPIDVERLPFYPLDPSLPLLVKCKLQAKELSFLLEALQKSLKEKMLREQTLPASERIRMTDASEAENDAWLAAQRKNLN
jgi:hypothetical protein